MNKGPMVLAGDIGGTKANLGLFVRGKGRPEVVWLQSYPSRKRLNLETIVGEFLKGHPSEVAGACFGIAGPVLNGRCKTTNLPWEVSEKQLKKAFQWQKVRLLNDLTATALSLALLTPSEVAVLNKGRPQKGGNLAIVAPGTGLGQAVVLFHEGKALPSPSEGGHVDFAPTSEPEVALWRRLQGKFGHASVERIVSGPGILELYLWLRDSGRFQEPAWLKERLDKEDPAKVIAECALKKEHALCVESLNHFVRILGAVAGNLALTALATGGVYLSGGIPPKVLPALKMGLFMRAFSDKGRFQALLSKIPVKVILNQRAAMLGAAEQAFQDLDA